MSSTVVIALDVGHEELISAVRAAIETVCSRLEDGVVDRSDAGNADVVDLTEFAVRRLTHTQYRSIAAIETSRDGSLA